MKAKRLSVRTLFRVSICIVVALAYLTLAAISFTNVTAQELKRAEASVRSEVNYVCQQLKYLGSRADVFDQIVHTPGVDTQTMESAHPEGFHVLSDPVGDVLAGYTLGETGTVAIIADDTVVATDDARVPVGSNAHDLLGDEVYAAIGQSLKDGQMQLVPYSGVFDETGGDGSYGDNDDEAYLLAGQQGRYAVIIIEPMGMVFRDRNAVMGRECTVGLLILVVASLIVDRLLDALVASRIDKTNAALVRITSGDLETRIEEDGTREFVSLASGINATVDALRGWIAEAEARMRSELSAARAIQESALPRTFPPFPQIPAFDVYALMDAAREVGGDFYDFFLLDGSGPNAGRLVFLIADVSGKGIPAALFMMEAKTQVRRELQNNRSLSEAMQNVNRELNEGNDSCMFVTMWVGVLDYETGVVEYVNCGHNPPLLWQGESGWQWMRERSGIPLGVIVTRPYKTYSIKCHPGDKFLLYTDGVNEAVNVDGTQYGDGRLEALANANGATHPEGLVKALRTDVAAFAQDAEQSDDITILALEIKRPADPPQDEATNA